MIAEDYFDVAKRVVWLQHRLQTAAIPMDDAVIVAGPQLRSSMSNVLSVMGLPVSLSDDPEVELMIGLKA